jgi:hypothetical protein
VQREVARGNIPDVVSLAGTSLDTPDELDALAKLPKPEQKALIARAKSGEKVSAKTALKKRKRDARERDLADNTAAASQRLGRTAGAVFRAIPNSRFSDYFNTLWRPQHTR